MLESFKNEIVEAENDRNDLLKWKIILVATLGAVSLGIGETFKSGDSKASPYMHYTICLIPFVCAYVDLLCKHLQIRILVISKFFQDCEIDGSESAKDEKQIFKKYENFCDSIRHVFVFEDWAQTISTYVLCGTVILVAIFFFEFNTKPFYIIAGSGVVGILLAWTIHHSCELKKDTLFPNRSIRRSKETKVKNRS